MAELPELPVRMALHTGEVILSGANKYDGMPMIRCARIRAAAHGGQVLLSSSTAAMLSGRVSDLGQRALAPLRDAGAIRLGVREEHPHGVGGSELSDASRQDGDYGRLGALAVREVEKPDDTTIGEEVGRGEGFAREGERDDGPGLRRSA